MIFRSIILFAVVGFAGRSFAKVDPKAFAAGAAEFSAFSAKKDLTAEVWVKSSSLPEPKQNEILQYLLQQKLEKSKLPQIEFRPGSTYIDVHGEKAGIKMDFARALDRKEILLNGRKWKVNPEDSFQALVDRAKTVLSDKSASFWQDLLLPEASANTPFNILENTVGFTIAVLFAIPVVNQIPLCNGADQNLNVGVCVFGSDTYWIQRVLESPSGMVGSKIVEFKCDEKNRFSSLQTTGGDMPFSVKWTYGEDGASHIELANVTGKCSFDLLNSKLIAGGSVKPEGTDIRCGGRNRNEFKGPHHKLNAGDVPYYFFGLGVPIERLQGACKSELSRQEMQKVLELNAPGSSIEGEKADK